MSVEHRPGKKCQGWSELWSSDDEKVQSAIRQVCALRDINAADYEGVSVTAVRIWRGRGEAKKVSFEPTPDELKSAPLGIRRVFKDIGITKSDKISLELEIPPEGSFQVTIRPHDITDNRIGITLSTVTEEGAVIVPLHGERRENKPPVVESVPFSPLYKGQQGRRMDSKGFYVMRAYTGISTNVDGNNLFLKRHPYMIEILTSVAKWSTSLLASRKRLTAS